MSSNIEKEPGPKGDSPEQSPGTPESEPEKKKREYKDFGHDEEKPTRLYSLIFNCQPLNLS